MARLTVGQRTQRVLGFMVGIRNRRVRRALAAHGFTEADFDDGWERLKAIAKTRMDSEVELLDPRLVVELDGWENRWFPIVDATLRHNHPALHAWVFRNLRQTEGVEVIVSVGTLLERLEQMVLPVDEGGRADGAAARALLERRGLTKEVIGVAQALLAELGSLEPETDEAGDTEADREARDRAEQRMWSWYLEWSAIARSAIRDRRLLRSLGFLQVTRLPNGTEVEEEVDEDTEDDVDVEDPVPAT